MGLGDFLGSILGSTNTFSAQPMALDKVDYNDAIKRAQATTLANMEAGAEAAKMQKSLAQQLMEQSQGQGPSLAQMQLQQAADQNIKNQAALIASQRGMNPAQAARSIAMQGASQGQNLASQAAQLRLNEQLQKQQLLEQTLRGQRGLDIGLLGAQTNLYGTAGQLGGAQQEREMQNYWNAQNINAGIAASNQAQNNAILGSLISGGSSIMAAGAKGGSPAPKAHGGYVGYSEGGAISQDSPNPEMSRVLVSPGEKVVNPDGKVMDVPGKAQYKGDDERNDTVIADLRKDAIVVPRTKAGDKEKMIEFLKHVKESSKKKSDLQQLLDSHNEIKQRLDEMNYKMGKWTPK
jgi:hypothetical protein